MSQTRREAVPQVVVPLRRLDRPALAALSYARSISADVTALFAVDDAADEETLRAQWRSRADGLPMVLRTSRDGSVLRVLLPYLDEREREDPERPVTVVVSDIVPRNPWGYLLSETALALKLRLFFRPNTVVVDVPYRL
jgi:hypothetical protein